MEMTVKELIEQLKQLDENAIVEIAGGFYDYSTSDVKVVQKGDYVSIEEA